MDIRPPKQPPRPPQGPPARPGSVPDRQGNSATPRPERNLPEPSNAGTVPGADKVDAQHLLESTTESKKRFRLNKKAIFAVLLGIVFIAIASVATWVYVLASPLDTEGHKRRVHIESGLAPREIAQELQEAGIIRSAFAFDILTRVQSVGDKLQAGTYVLSPAQPLSEVLEYLVEGRVDPLRVTILPGYTIEEVTDDLVKNYGFQKDGVQAALSAAYDHPLLAGKPQGASLEGYIFPETYEIGGDASPEALFEQTFDIMWERIQDQDLQRLAKKRGFTLHQAITLASVIERETNPDEKEQKQVSQIFQKRLKINMPLGADATFVYGARQLGVTPSVDVQSPYNTRIHKGLPPGPISNFNLLALEAVVSPAKGDYLYFVHSDDSKIHYARTVEEHEENIRLYCGEKCALY